MMNAGMLRTNEELYRLMKAGERDAFASLYDRLEPGLYRYVLHMTANQSAAEEIGHEVFVQLMTTGARFDERKGCLEGWIYGVARNLVRAFRRKGPVEQPVDQAVYDDIVGDLIHDENIAALRLAIAELPDGYRDAVVLCDLEERNYDEAARLMGCPIGTVRSRLHRARGLLAGKLRRLRPVMEMSVR